MMAAAETRDLVVLLVEDNPADVLLAQEAAEANNMHRIDHVVQDGVEALQFLRRQGRHAGAPRPDIVILDLNLPLKSGQEVLKEMADDAELSDIQVAVLTTSTSEEWVCNCYPRGRCAYFVKTENFSDLQEIMHRIDAHARAGGDTHLAS